MSSRSISSSRCESAISASISKRGRIWKERRKKLKKSSIGEKIKLRNPNERIKSYEERKDKKEATLDQELEPLSSVFENLDAHFRRQDQLADANNAYYQAKYAELQEARESGWSWDRSCKELAWVFWGLPSGYGTKFWWLLSWVLIVDLIFTLLYSTWGKLHRYESPEGKQDFTFKPRLLDMPWDYIGKGAFPEAMPRMAGEEDQIVPAGSKDDQARVLRVEDRGFRKILTAFLFSTVMLLKVGFRDTTVSGHIGWVDLRVIVWFEWVLGFLLVAALTITLANTQPLLNKLVTGVF